MANDIKTKPVTEMYGENVFGLKNMRNYLSDSAYKSLVSTIKEGRTLGKYHSLVAKNMFPMFYSAKIFDYMLGKNPFPVQSLRMIKPFLVYLAKNLS